MRTPRRGNTTGAQVTLSEETGAHTGEGTGAAKQVRRRTWSRKKGSVSRASAQTPHTGAAHIGITPLAMGEIGSIFNRVYNRSLTPVQNRDGFLIGVREYLSGFQPITTP